MPYNGGGTFTPYVPGTPFTNGTTADADVMNLVDNDFATGLTTAWPRDGQAPPTANIPMGGYKFTGMGSGTAATDSATLAQVQSSITQDAGTTGGTSTAYTAALTPAITAYATGLLARVKFDQTCGATPTINFNSVGARKIYYMLAGTVTQTTTGDILGNFVASLRYDGSLDSGTGGFLILNPSAVLLVGAQTIAGAKTFSGLVTASAGVSSTTLTASSTVQGTQLISTVATGTAPLTVASTTKVTNLNADLLDGMDTATAATASTVVVRDASGGTNFGSSGVASTGGFSTPASFTSTVATGTAPLVVSSTTKVTNLNADLLDGLDTATAATASTVAARDGSGGLTVAALVATTGTFSSTVQGTRLISTIATGTAPLTVTSTTVVSNLHADFADKAVASGASSSISATPGTGVTTLFSGVSSAVTKYRVALTFVVSGNAFGFVTGDEIQIQPSPTASAGMPTIYRSGTDIKMRSANSAQYVCCPDGSDRRLDTDIPGTYTAVLQLEGNYP